MHVQHNVSLQSHSTMRLGGNAAYLAEVTSRDDIRSLASWAIQNKLPVLLIGDGSNIVWSDSGWPGLVMVNKLKGITESVMGDQVYLTAASGENWDQFVAHSVGKGLTGIEFLSLVPGTVGATPVQNVGAYGQEVANTIVTIEAYDMQAAQFVTIRGDECSFRYRNSRFKSDDKGRFLITAVTFGLRRGSPTRPFYGAVEQYCQEHAITDLTPASGREAVITIRRAKLPDPATIANNGSFFANPIVSADRAFELISDFPDIVQWPMDDGRVKLSAAWLIEHAGFKDAHDAETGMGTWPKQPLVLVNEHATSTAQLLQFRQKILTAVQKQFGLQLEQGPELIGKI